nr:hypothetical protein [Tanacetum cinerariifolium]
MNMIEQKIALLEATTTITDVSKSESLKTKAIPKQTALGKESSNPLKAEVLLKNLKDNTDPSSLSKTSKLVHSSPHTAGSSKMIILSPNNLVQELTPDYLKAVKQEPRHYYVIYKGPHSGIHTDWGVTEAFCNNDKVTCKKFKSEKSARLGAKKKVNYVNNNCIITSWSFSNTNEEDIQADSQFGEKFMKNNIQASSTTRQSFCRHLKQLFEDHYCQYCIDNNATKSGPSTEEESSTE